MSTRLLKRTYNPYETLERMLNKTTLTTQRVAHTQIIGKFYPRDTRRVSVQHIEKTNDMLVNTAFRMADKKQIHVKFYLVLNSDFVSF